MANLLITKPTTANHLSIKVQTLAALAATIGAVALPQIFHAFGALFGLGTGLGEIFLPMHLPIILVGILAGPYAGSIAGLLGPLTSFALSGMPGSAMLPFMIIELTAYGLFAGLLQNVKVHTIGKVIASQFAGRVVRAAAILLAVYAFGNESVSVSIIWTSIITGLPGLLLQWSFLPLLIFFVNNRSKHEQ